MTYDESIRYNVYRTKDPEERRELLIQELALESTVTDEQIINTASLSSARALFTPESSESDDRTAVEQFIENMWNGDEQVSDNLR